MNIAFTIATANYLSQAKAVSDSFLHHNPGWDFKIILLDKVDGRFDTSYFLPAEIDEVENLQIPEFLDMLSRYTIFELSNALKPFVAEYLFKHYADLNKVLYFDSDIFIYHALAEIADLLERHSFVITAHFYKPPPSDGLMLDEKAFLNSGIYNGGFFAVNRSAESMQLLGWWKDRMKTECLVDFSRGLFVDQIWMNFMPLYFSNVFIIRNPGYNVAYWNLHERNISFQSGDAFINQTAPLIFFHFSGFIFDGAGGLSRYQTRYSFEEKQEIIPLFASYKKVVLSNNYQDYSTLVCYYVELKQKEEEKERIGREDKYGLEKIKKKLKKNLKRLNYKN